MLSHSLFRGSFPSTPTDLPARTLLPWRLALAGRPNLPLGALERFAQPASHEAAVNGGQACCMSRCYAAEPLRSKYANQCKVESNTSSTATNAVATQEFMAEATVSSIAPPAQTAPRGSNNSKTGATRI